MTEKNKEKKVVLYDEFRNDDEDFEKDLKSKDNKGKKMTEAEKNLLLGDLKNFSKSFKLPTKWLYFYLLSLSFLYKLINTNYLNS